MQSGKVLRQAPSNPHVPENKNWTSMLLLLLIPLIGSGIGYALKELKEYYDNSEKAKIQSINNEVNLKNETIDLKQRLKDLESSNATLREINLKLTSEETIVHDYGMLFCKEDPLPRYPICPNCYYNDKTKKIRLIRTGVPTKYKDESEIIAVFNCIICKNAYGVHSQNQAFFEHGHKILNDIPASESNIDNFYAFSGRKDDGSFYYLDFEEFNRQKLLKDQYATKEAAEARQVPNLYASSNEAFVDGFKSLLENGHLLEKDYAGAAAAFELALGIPAADHAQVKKWLTTIQIQGAKDTEWQLAIQRAMEKAPQDQMAPAVPERTVRTTFSPDLTGAQVPPQSFSDSGQWFAIIDGKSSGPFTPHSLGNEIASGRVTHTTPVWRDGMKDWVVAGVIPEITLLFPAISSPIPKYVVEPVATQSSPEANDTPQSTKSGGMESEVKGIREGASDTLIQKILKNSR